jgi:Tol biopolymer transport system component
VRRLSVMLFATALATALPAAEGGTPSSPRIAFQSAMSGDYEIWSMRLDGTGLRNLTHTKGYDGDPAWSPDGKRIAFTSYRTGWPKIFVMNADGSRQRQLTRRYSKDGGAAWTPDASHIVYGTLPDPPVAGAPGWWIMRADGTQKRPLPRSYSGRPSWSPSGRQAVMAGRCGLETCIFRINRNGSGKQQLWYAERVDNSTPSWSPDGRLVAWIHATELWVMNADGSDPHRLAPGPLPETYDHGPNWSPDGSRVLFGTNRSPTGIAVINRDGTGLTPVGVGRVTRGAWPVWQPGR